MRRGFTLIELLLAVAVGVVLLATATTAFMQVRGMVQRRNAVLALHRDAAVIHAQFDRRLSAAAQHAVFVADARSVPRDGPTLRLLFLRGKQQANDWERNANSQFQKDQWLTENTDLLWELWEYRPEEQALHIATSRRDRSFIASAPPAMLGQRFAAMPQPRGDLAGPDWWSALDANQRFPADAAANPDDLGDWGDLRRQLRPALAGVRAMDVEVLQHGGGRTALAAAWDGSAASASTPVGASPLIIPGLPVDGAAADAAGRLPGAAGWDWTTTRAAQRPRLLRLRLTLVDAATGIDQVFSFSLPLPAVAAP